MYNIKKYLLEDDRAKLWFKEAREWFLKYIFLMKDEDQKDDIYIYLKNVTNDDICDNSKFIALPDFDTTCIEFEDSDRVGKYIFELKKYEETRINEINPRIEPDDKTKYKIIDSRFFNVLVRDRYSDNDKSFNEIIFYNKNIEELLEKTKCSLEKAIKPIYIYSLFTLFIRYISNQCDKNKYRNDYISYLVKESLSLFLAKTYSRINNLDCKFLLDNIEKYSPEIYPFSGTKYIKGRIHFNEILELSITDFDSAFKRLFEGRTIKVGTSIFQSGLNTFEEEIRIPLSMYILNFRNFI